MCSRPPKSPTIVGSAVATIVWSSEASSRTSKSPAKTTRTGFCSVVMSCPAGVSLGVLGRDVGGVLVPVPHARIGVEVARRVAWVERVADPLERERLVHEAAVRAVEREALAAVAPGVRVLGGPERVRTLVPAVAYEPLARPAGVHREGELLVVLGDRERAGIGAGPAPRVRPPGGRERLRHGAAVHPRDRLDVALPAALRAVAPGLGDAVVPELLLHVADQPRYALDHQVVQRAPLVLHRLAQRTRRVGIAAVERLDRAVHRRARHLAQLVVGEPALGHSFLSKSLVGATLTR